MSYIKVNHAKLETAAKKIDDSIGRQRNHLKSADDHVKNMKQIYDGEDYNAFLVQWLRVNAKNSTVDNVTKGVEGFADMLRYAANEYKKAQTNSINKSLLLLL